MFTKIGQEGCLSERVAREVLQYILDNKLREGDRLPNETTLAASLNVGRSTVREAMKQLASQNIIVIARGRGTFVKSNPGQVSDPLGFRFAENKQKLLMDLIEYRLIVEPPIAALAARRRTDRDVEHIFAALREMERVIGEGKNHGAADARLHASIAEASQNSVSSALVPTLNHSVDLIISISGKSSLERTMAYHRKICEAIAARDARMAENTMREHLSDHRDFVFKVFGVDPETGKDPHAP